MLPFIILVADSDELIRTEQTIKANRFRQIILKILNKFCFNNNRYVYENITCSVAGMYNKITLFSEHVGGSFFTATD